MTDDATLVGDSSMHTASEPAPGGGFYRHRLTIRFNSGETLIYNVREPLHAEDISATMRFAVISSYKCETPDKCTEIILLNLNSIAFIKTEHVTDAELQGEETAHIDPQLPSQTMPAPQHLSHIGFI